MTGIFLTFILALTIQSCFPCGFVTDLQNATFQVDESASPRKSTPVTIQVSPDVRRIDFSSGSEDNTKYFDFVLDRTTSLVHLLPKEALTNFFDVSDSDTVEVQAPKLKCSGGSEFISSYPIRVTVEDVNDKPPEFAGPIETKVFNIELPYRGAPVNWNQVLKVTDGDFKEENTQLQFYAEPQGLVKIMPNPPVKVMSNGRLMYYEVYFSLEETWETPGLYPVTIMASDGIHFDSLTLELNITKGPDMQQPMITEDKSYHSERLNNTVGETIVAATIVDDMGATEDLYIKVQGKYGRKFGVVVNETTVSLQLKRAFTPEQLQEVEHLVRVNLLATDASGNSASLPLAIQFQKADSCTNQPDMSDENEISKSGRKLPEGSEMAAEGIHLTIMTDDNDSVTSIGANLTGDIKNKFEVAMQPDGTVHLRLKDEFLDRSMELLDNEWMIHLTLTITDDKNHLTPRQQKELGMQGRKAIKMLPDGEMKIQDEDGGTTTEMTTEGTTTETTTDGTTTETATDGTTTEMATDGTTTEMATDGTTTETATDGTTTEITTDGTTTQMTTDGTTTQMATDGTTEMPTTTTLTLSGDDEYSAENEVPEESRIESRIYQPPTPVEQQQRPQSSSGQRPAGGRNLGYGQYDRNQEQSSYGQFPPQSQSGQRQRGQRQRGQNQAQNQQQYGQQQSQYSGGQQQQGTRQEHICSAEGFFADPNSCTKFHRCVYNIHSGRYTDYRMDCGPGVDLWCQSTLSCSYSYQCPEKCTANSADTEQYEDQ